MFFPGKSQRVSREGKGLPVVMERKTKIIAFLKGKNTGADLL